jgi:hypothetical protein
VALLFQNQSCSGFQVTVVCSSQVQRTSTVLFGHALLFPQRFKLIFYLNYIICLVNRSSGRELTYPMAQHETYEMHCLVCMIYVLGWYNAGSRLSLSSPSGVPYAMAPATWISHYEYEENEFRKLAVRYSENYIICLGELGLSLDLS